MMYDQDYGSFPVDPYAALDLAHEWDCDEARDCAREVYLDIRRAAKSEQSWREAEFFRALNGGLR